MALMRPPERCRRWNGGPYAQYGPGVSLSNRARRGVAPLGRGPAQLLRLRCGPRKPYLSPRYRPREPATAGVFHRRSPRHRWQPAQRHCGPVLLRHHGPPRTPGAAYRRVGVETHHWRIAQRSRLVEPSVCPRWSRSKQPPVATRRPPVREFQAPPERRRLRQSARPCASKVDRHAPGTVETAELHRPGRSVRPTTRPPVRPRASAPSIRAGGRRLG